MKAASSVPLPPGKSTTSLPASYYLANNYCSWAASLPGRPRERILALEQSDSLSPPSAPRPLRETRKGARIARRPGRQPADSEGDLLKIRSCPKVLQIRD